MDNLQSSNIQAHLNRIQQEGGKTAASLFGAATSGKADEERHKTSADPQEKVELSQGRQAPGISKEDKAPALKKGPDRAPSPVGPAGEQKSDRQPAEILKEGPPMSEESLRAAEAIVREQIKGEKTKSDMTKVKKLGEPKLLDMRLEESEGPLDIHDELTKKPLEPQIEE
ncbi:MAG: hypothetical protein RDV48_10700 [Candidatus Eremiobacteraeota bacterium]|nr:hypothetical protein [Candidatus Eremiobacteraeota bacterium]